MKRKLLGFVLLCITTFVLHNHHQASTDEIFLYRALAKISPNNVCLNQGAIGTCVAAGHAGACNVLMAMDYVTGKSGKFLPASIESIYGGARNEIYGRASHSYSDGSSGSAATKWLAKVGGVLYQQNYPSLGVDLSTYNISRAKDWGAWGNGGSKDGIGGPADKEASSHPIKTVAKVTTLEELDAALIAGYPVTICSGQGFTRQKDADGFCRPSGSWSHCMLCTGKRNGGRKGYLIQNSWANYLTGGSYNDQPVGSFYAEPQVVARMLAQNDSWALSGETGFPRKILPDWFSKPNAVVPANFRVDSTRINEVNFKAPRFVVFTASWCGPCQNLKETLNHPSVKEYLNGFKVYEVDVDKNPEIAKEYGVKSIPAYFVIDGDKYKAKGEGYKTPKQMVQFLQVQ